MPITIRPSVVKIKKPSTGEYREINALLDTDSAKTVYYGVSSTAADTQTKTVTIEGISALSDGLLVRILFTNAQSYSGVPKLMINSTAASNIKTRKGTDATNLTWKAGDVLDFVYDSSSSGFIVLDKGDIEDLNGVITNNLKFPNKIKVLQSGDDLDDYYSEANSGWYEVRNGVANAPLSWCRCLVIGGNGASQVIFATNQIFVRMYTGSPLTWSEWVGFATYSDRNDILKLFAPVLSSLVADTALSQGMWRIYGNELYEITASVASGAALTVGTNCKKTTLTTNYVPNGLGTRNTTNTSNSNVYYRRQGRWCNLNGWFVPTVGTNGATYITDLPKADTNINMLILDGTSGALGYIQIPYGETYIRAAQTLTSFVGHTCTIINATYPIYYGG